KAQELFRQGKFRMIRKSPQEMLAVRRLVFDNEHQPKDLIGKVPRPRWGAEGTTGWKPDHEKEPKHFQHSSGADAALAWLRYQHLIPDHDRLQARAGVI